MAAGRYDRWLKNAETWAHEEDWNPDEYFKWVKRLAEAKANLDDTYREVDKHLIGESAKLAKKHDDLIRQGKGGSGKRSHAYSNPQHVAKMVVRYCIAYNFFERATFEEASDSVLVSRIQHHLLDLEIGMLDVDIAHMLQCAADKVCDS